MIYIISNGNEIKIGKSKHPKKRLKQLQTGCAKNLQLLKIYDVPDYYEKRIHHILRNFRFRFKSEWFYCHDLNFLLITIDNILNNGK